MLPESVKKLKFDEPKVISTHAGILDKKGKFVFHKNDIWKISDL